jgi:hypothetical protein
MNCEDARDSLAQPPSGVSPVPTAPSSPSSSPSHMYPSTPIRQAPNSLDEYELALAIPLPSSPKDSIISTAGLDAYPDFSPDPNMSASSASSSQAESEATRSLSYHQTHPYPTPEYKQAPRHQTHSEEQLSDAVPGALPTTTPPQSLSRSTSLEHVFLSAALGALVAVVVSTFGSNASFQ